MLLKCAAGVKFAIIGHTLGFWMYKIHFSLQTVTFLGTIFAVPFALKPLWYSLLNKYFTINYTLTKIISTVEYTFLLLVTFLPAGELLFLLSVGIAALCGATLDAILVGEMRRKTHPQFLKTISRHLYISELIGMIAGNTGVIYLSQFIAWHMLYRITIIVTLGLVILNIHYLEDTQSCKESQFMTASIEFLQRLKLTGIWLTGIVLAYRFQSAFLAHTLQLFLLDEKLSITTITLIKSISYLGMALGILLAAYTPSYPRLVLLVRNSGLLMLASLASTGILRDNPQALMLVGIAATIERFAQFSEQLILKELQLLHSSKNHASIQISTLDSIGMAARFGGEILSGCAAAYLGWTNFFLGASGATLIVGALLLMRARVIKESHSY